MDNQSGDYPCNYGWTTEPLRAPQNILSFADRPQNAINRRLEFDRQSVSQSDTKGPKKSNVKCITFSDTKEDVNSIRSWAAIDDRIGGVGSSAQGWIKEWPGRNGMPRNKNRKEWVGGDYDLTLIFCLTLWLIVRATVLVSISNTACSHLCGLLCRMESNKDELLKGIS